MFIAQITDLHVRPRGRLAYGRVATNAMLEHAVAAINALDPKPDCVIASGDLTDCGLVEEYEVLRDILAPLAMPIYLIPGNHDRRENLREVFADHAYLPQAGEFIQYVIEDHPVRLIGLDSVVPGADHGELCAARLDWLEAQLEAGKGRPTVIFQHHPPFDTGLPQMDVIKCRATDRFRAIVARHDNIERVLCGHHHRPIQVRWAGTIATIGPSTAHQVELDFVGDKEAKFVMEPAAFQVHTWVKDTGIVSHHAYAGHWGGPYAYLADPDYPGAQAG